MSGRMEKCRVLGAHDFPNQVKCVGTGECLDRIQQRAEKSFPYLTCNVIQRVDVAP